MQIKLSHFRNLLLVSFLLVFVFSFSSGEATKSGLITFVEGTAKKQKTDDEMWQSVYENTEVIGGDRVRTFAQSRAELDITEFSKIRMAPKTTIDILKLYEESKDNKRESKIQLQSGDLWANVKKSSDTKFSIGTPVAAAAITGTILRLHVEPDSSAEVKVYNGEVVLSNAPENKTVIPKSLEPYEIPGPYEVQGPQEVSLEEWAVIVKSMQKVKIDKNGRIVQSAEFKLSDSDENSDWVRWNRARDDSLK